MIDESETDTEISSAGLTNQSPALRKQDAAAEEAPSSCHSAVEAFLSGRLLIGR